MDEGTTRIARFWILTVTIGVVVGWFVLRPAPQAEAPAPTPYRPATQAAPENKIEFPPRLPERELGAMEVSRASSDPDVSATPSVLLSTRKSMLPNAEAVPGVAVALGLGAPLDPNCAPLAVIVTDECGTARLTIPAEALRVARAKPGTRVWARVVSPGFQQRTHSRPLPEGSESVEITLAPRPGGTLRGYLSDAEGRPASGHVRAGSRKPSGALALESSADAGTDGWFEMLLTREGTYQVLADARESGTAVIRDLEVRFTDSSAPIEMHTVGPGILRGRVHDSAGRGSSGLEILAVVSALDDARGSLALPQPQATEMELDGRGRLWSTLQTRADGTFEVRGLRSDRYVVRARRNRSASFGPYPEILTPVAVESDGSALDVLFGRPHLAVRIENADHSPWPGKLHLDTRPYPGPPEEWSAEVSVLVFPARAEAHLDERESACLQGRAVEGGEVVFEANAGRHYKIGLVGGSQGWNPVEAWVSPESSRVEVVLTATPEVPRGTLVVSAFDRSGATVTHGLALRIEDPILGVPLVERRSSYAPWPQRVQLAEGDYRLVVEGLGNTDNWHGVLITPRAHGRFESLFHIERDRETEVRADLPPGARVHLRLQGVVLDQDLDATRKRYEGMTLGESIDARAGRPSIILISGDRWPEPVEFTIVIKGSSAAGTHLTSMLPLGTDATSQVLPSGSYRIEARMPGGRLAAQEVVLVEGQTTEVTLTFE